MADSDTTSLLPDSFVPFPMLTIIERLLDSRIDTVGSENKPKSLVETFWLNELELAWRKVDVAERAKKVMAL